MGVITISLDDEIEKKLRTLATARFRKRKGYLAMAISEALREWVSKKQEQEMGTAIDMLEKGIDLGGIISKKKEDLHKR